MITENVSTAPPPPIQQEKDHWTEIIESRTKLIDLRLNELWRYRDLVMMFVRRDFVTNYKQTVLGPVWFFLQPLLTSFTYILIFGRVAKLSTDGLPMMVFYLAGITIWNYFSETLTKTATVFKDNAQMFGKVYFPRLTMPFSIVISNLVRFVIQFALFILICSWYFFRTNSLHPNWYMLLAPLLVVMMGLLALGCGMIVSAMTTKYKDLIFLLTFGVQLLMFATPVIYPISSIPQKYKALISANPISPIVETFRYAFLGTGSFSWNSLAYSCGITVFILLLGTIIFNRVEKSFTDTV
jgi:lipopolysaccharide transport system permease protein